MLCRTHMSICSLATVAAVESALAMASAQDISIAEAPKPEISFSVAFDGTNFLVGLRGDGTWNHSVGAQFVSPAGGLVGSLTPTGHRGSAPYVAFGGGKYLMVWDSDSMAFNDDAWGIFVPPGGVPGVPFSISTSIHGGEVAGLASDGTNFLVAYRPERIPGVPDVGPIAVRVITAAGAVGNEITVSTTMNAEIGHDAVAYGAGNYVVVWTETPPVSSTVVGRLVGPTGVPGALFTVDNSPGTQQGGAGVEFDGSSNFLVVWSRESAGAGTNTWDVYARSVSSAGIPSPGPAIAVNHSEGAQVFPFVGFDGSNFLVTWTEQINDLDGDGMCDGGEATCIDVSGQFISPVGALLRPAFSIARRTGNQYVSPLAFGAGRYLVAYGQGIFLGSLVSDVRGTFIDPLGTQAPAAYCTSKANSLGCTPLITWNGTPRVGNPAPFTIEALNVRNLKSGLLFYGTSGAASLPFQGGTMCVALPVRRTTIQNSGGSGSGNDCTGHFSLDFNAYIASGTDSSLLAGVAVRAEYWSRDPGSPPVNTSLSNAIGFTIAP